MNIHIKPKNPKPEKIKKSDVALFNFNINIKHELS